MTKNIRIRLWYLFMLLVSIGHPVHAQEPEASVQVLARSLENRVLLRWAVDQPYAWKKANEYGFLVERATISRNEEAVIPIERQLLVPKPLKPKPQVEWVELANKDQNVAVIAQALFGESFETTGPAQGAMGSIMAVNDELEQRFTFGLLAAEQSYGGALLAGWGYEDTNTQQGEKYVYTVSVALVPDSALKITPGTTFAGSDLYEELPVPISFAGAFKDSKVELSWNFNLLSSYYTSYFVERSEDGRTFSKLNKTPVFNATQVEGDSENSMFYADSIPNNIMYHYRVKGKTAFDEIGPASQAISGKAMKSLGFVPRISMKEIPDDKTAILHWYFKEEGNELITGFELKRGNKVDGPFITVEKNIPPTARKTTFKGLQRINYFTIVAMGKNGVESPSFSAVVQPVDSIPPKAPIGLMGKMDTTGIVTISWNKNLEDDLAGYRIFKANNPNVEFSEVTNEIHKSEAFIDTVQIRNLNTKVYYKIQAEDQRFNRSQHSPLLSITKPDMVPPSPPVLTKFEVTEEGMRINWIPSSSTDIASHSIYRKNGNSPETNWEQLVEFSSKRDTTFLDSKELKPNAYSYTVVAKDSVGLESTPSNALTVLWKGRTLEEEDINFSGIVNRELRFINLSWRVKNFEVIEYRLYRGTSESGLKLYRTLEGSAKGYNDVDLEINSEYVYGIQVLLNGDSASFIKKINLKY